MSDLLYEIIESFISIISENGGANQPFLPNQNWVKKMRNKSEQNESK